MSLFIHLKGGWVRSKEECCAGDFPTCSNPFLWNSSKPKMSKTLISNAGSLEQRASRRLRTWKQRWRSRTHLTLVPRVDFFHFSTAGTWLLFAGDFGKNLGEFKVELIKARKKKWFFFSPPTTNYPQKKAEKRGRTLSGCGNTNCAD